MAGVASQLGLLHPPSVSLATLSCLLFTSSYVGCLYLVPDARSRPHLRDEKDGRQLDRQHPRVIKARLKGTGMVSVLSVVGVGGLIARGAGKDVRWEEVISRTLRLTGLAIPTSALPLLRSLTLPLLLTATLFLGPLYTRFLDYGPQGLLPWYRPEYSREEVQGWRGVRNFVAGPVTEEVVFRSCVVGTMAMSGAGMKKLVFLSPCWFAVAHVHHIWEVYVTQGRDKDALIRGTIQAGVQFAYTSLFGWYAAFVFTRTASLYATTLCHAFCNFLGLPPFLYAWQEYPRKRAQTVSAYVTGIAGFAYGLWKLTEPALYGGSLYWV